MYPIPLIESMYTTPSQIPSGYPPYDPLEARRRLIEAASMLSGNEVMQSYPFPHLQSAVNGQTPLQMAATNNPFLPQFQFNAIPPVQGYPINRPPA